MTRLLVAVLVVAGLWMGWWVAGATAYEKGLKGWLDARRAEGWAADVGDLDVHGFPNRFDTTVTELRLADPDTGIAWSAPFVQFLSLAYKPHQVIIALPDSHLFSTPLQTMTIQQEEARGSLFMEPSTALGLDSARLVTGKMKVTSSLGWVVALEGARFAAEKLPAAAPGYRVGAEVIGLAPPEGLKLRLDPGGILPGVLERFHLDATLDFDRPWDRRAIEEARPQITALDLTDLSARWGEVTFRAAGKLSVDPLGVPEGRITVRAVEWRRLLDMAVSTGLVPEPLKGTLEGVFDLMSGRKDTLDVPLQFAGGSMSLGPIPLGPAPRFVIR